MSQTMPTTTLAAKEAAKNNQNNAKSLSLYGQSHLLQRKEHDPLLRGRQSVFHDVLRQREQQQFSEPKEQEKGLLYTLGLDDEAEMLKKKANSLLVQLGLKETGKSHTLRRSVSHETRQVIADPEEHTGKKQSPLLAEAQQAVSRNVENSDKKSAKEEGADASVQNPEKQSPVLLEGAGEVEESARKQAKAEPAPPAAQSEHPQGSIMAEGSYGLRMPVSTRLRNAVAVDMVAEKKAREVLTKEAKEALLPVTGELSAVFESGKDGIAAIGYDRRGGTSYGKYQIASRVGSMKMFLNFLDDKAPEWADRLRSAGPANTRSRWGGMPSEWKKIAAEDPEKFELYQDQYIMSTNYQPAADGIKARADIDVAELSPAIREVLWSTAVQHGARGASKIFAKAASKADGKEGQEFDKAMIEEIYRVRKRNFSSSTSSVRRAVQSRLNTEKDMALELLAKNNA